MTSDSSVPEADLSPAPRRWGAAWIPLGAAVLVLSLLAAQWARHGPEVTLILKHGHGLSPGDPVRSRGVAVGEVLDVRLENSGQSVAAIIRLRPEARSLARAGSRYWVQRPRLGWSGIEGLETLTGPVYLSALPGSGAVQTRFEALADPPILDEGEAEGLELVLEAARRGNLEPGAPIQYRQFPIGRVLSVSLAPDGAGVRIRTWIDRRYQSLIREKTAFWMEGGAEFDAGLLRGVRLRIDSLQAVIGGAIGLANPPQPGEPAGSGQRFRLLEEPPKDAANWNPPIALISLNDSAQRPALLRATLQTQKPGIFRSARSRNSWVCPVKGGFLMPADLLPAGDQEPFLLEAGGERITLGAPPAGDRQGVLFLPIELKDADGVPQERLGRLEKPQICLVVADPALEPMVLEADRLKPLAGGHWGIDPALSFSQDLHGAAVLLAETGRLVGLLLVQEGLGTIAPVPAELVASGR